MGNWSSTINERKKRKKLQSSKRDIPSKQDEYKDSEIELMRNAIKTHPDRFILNNLMMCIQFFENYEDDILQIKETLASSYEAKLNKQLPPQKHVLLPDILQEYIARNIIFTSKRQTDDPSIEPLQPVRIYVVYDNIEITEQHYQPEYSSLNNGITYNVMVQSSEHSGYVRLRCLDEMPYPRNLNERVPSLITNDDEIYYSDSSIYRGNSNMMRQIKTKNLQTSVIRNIGSLPNLHYDETIYEDQVSLSHVNIYKTRSNSYIKSESDLEHISSIDNQRIDVKKTISRSELNHEIRKENYQQTAQPSKLMNSKVVCRPPSTIYSTESSGYRSGVWDSDSDYNYRVATSSVQTTCNTNHDEMDTSTKIYSNAIIPTQCFRKVKITNEGKIYTTREERKLPQNSKQLRLMMIDRQYDCEVFYISSERFMRHFCNFFVNQLAEPLGFKLNDPKHMKNSVIHWDKIMKSYNRKHCKVESYEITPTICLQWPECAQEWLNRPRNTWPNHNDVNKVKDFGCYVVPENSFSKQNQNLQKSIYQEIEWQLAFPAAERYLETCMTHSQVQVYLIALMLHKTFLRPVKDTMHGLTTSHIRNMLFWLIEKDGPSMWPDNWTGECLIKLLRRLYYCINKSEPTLPDYFMRDKNMLSKISRDDLYHSQKQLQRIIGNPLMYVFHAMKNIKHDENFFPRLNFTKLFKILTVEPWLGVESLMNPTLDMPRMAEESYREEIYNRSDRFWDNTRMKNHSNYNTRVITSKTDITSRKATDSIIEISECASLKGLRLVDLLNFFIDHFIKMAKYCHRYRSYQQKKVYLDQADRLTIILSDLTRCKDNVKTYRDDISALRMKVATNSTRLPNKPPETPKRNEPIFIGSMKDRYTPQCTEVPMQSKDEQSHSNHEHMDKITETVIHEVQFKDEKNANKEAETITNATTSNEDSCISTSLVSKNQSHELALDINQKVVSLADPLSETTYI
ncbi:uncharacterized protein LOC114939195 [Nylanderia fulva]|uniref:uncharacterized protein LOC114939195 n=1 Tax=Nylanderia fulva TaxID=613905 RepID=UPI0010FAF37E|nr:uncharacterized protein LOC114939195 [Nylanderia fulva]